MKTELLSVRAAADNLGISPRRVQQLIQSGQLPAEALAGTNILMIRAQDLALVRDRKKAGRPRKPPG